MSSKKSVSPSLDYQDLTDLQRENIAKQIASEIASKNINLDTPRTVKDVTDTDLKNVLNLTRSITADVDKINDLMQYINIDVEGTFVELRSVDDFRDIVRIGRPLENKYFELIDLLKELLADPKKLQNIKKTEWDKIRKAGNNLGTIEDVILEIPDNDDWVDENGIVLPPDLEDAVQDLGELDNRIENRDKAYTVSDILKEIQESSEERFELTNELTSRIREGRFSSQQMGNGRPDPYSVQRKFR